MVLRHHNEAESLNAVQKMDWEWKLGEIPGAKVSTYLWIMTTTHFGFHVENKKYIIISMIF